MEEHPQARYIIEILAKAGFVAYYAGGWVRDFLLNHPSDDIDIATNAPPETIQTLFPRTIPIGIAFGIVLVVVDQHQYEVATFRQDFDYADGRRPKRIAFTTAEEDAKRRDFTINGMFYDPLTEKILDYVGGQEDLKLGVIRAIGDPHLRIQEDRLRMIRAIRLSCRFQFPIEPKTGEAIRVHANELFPAVAIERIVQEFEKGKNVSRLRTMLMMLHDYGLLETIFPELRGILVEEMEKRLEPLKYYPEKAPLIGQLMALFPDATLEISVNLCKKLKLSNLDQQFALFLFRARERLMGSGSISLSEWAYFYANAFAPVSIQIVAAHLSGHQRLSFLREHGERIGLLSCSIERIRSHTPLVTSADLLEEGIVPGILMGRLLKEADRLSIDEQLQDTASVINRLKQSPDWPCSKNSDS